MSTAIPYGTPHCTCTAAGIDPKCPWHGEADQ